MPAVRANRTKIEQTPERVVLEKIVVIAVNLLATAHIVWFYLMRVPTYVDLARYEVGTERMPFQGRVLMEYPLRWAHTSAVAGGLATWLTSMHLWLPRGVLPEDVVEFVFDFAAVVVAGLVARDMYRFHSKQQRLTAYVYPFFLVMVAGAYCMAANHFFRFFYDLPSLGLFALGLYLIYRRRSLLLFAMVFVVATLNRETSLFLLLFLVLSYCVVDEKFVWQRALSWKIGGTAGVLALFWMAWHVWVTRHFAGLASESAHHVLVNFGFLIWPLCWPQVYGVAAYTLPVLVIFKTRTRNTELRLWAWVVPVWAVFMMFFGIVSEIRLFGELIPLFVCMGVLLAEERLFSLQTTI
jgi:hypothetical protein